MANNERTTGNSLPRGAILTAWNEATGAGRVFQLWEKIKKALQWSEATETGRNFQLWHDPGKMGVHTFLQDTPAAAKAGRISPEPLTCRNLPKCADGSGVQKSELCLNLGDCRADPEPLRMN